MDIVNNLNEHFRIDAYKAAALKEDIESLDSFSNIAIPDDYKDFVRKMTEAEILLDNGAYVRIWGPLGCIEMNTIYNVQKYIPISLAVGDDEGDMMLVLMTGENGFGLYKVGFGDICTETAEYIASSLTDLLVYGIGGEKI